MRSEEQFKPKPAFSGVDFMKISRRKW